MKKLPSASGLIPYFAGLFPSAIGLILLLPFYFLLLPCSAQVISGGGLHSLSLCSDSTVSAWGNNSDGQLGVGDTIDKPTPQPVSGITSITALATGGNPLEGLSHSLAIKNDSTVWVWGNNMYGQLGVNDTLDSWTPLQVHGLANVGFLTGISAVTGGGYHSLALKNDGTVWAWGRNKNGQLGVGDTIRRTTPVQVSGLTNITAITAGWGHSFALKNDSTVWSWGQNFFGQLGLGDTTDRTTPVQITGLNGITAISSGGGHSIALKNDGTVWSWGYNSLCQLGDSTTIDKHIPVQVGLLTGIIAISAGAGHTLALKNDSTTWAWGYNGFGELGDSTTTNRCIPVQVRGPGNVDFLTSITVISGGGGHSLALKNDSTLWAWGFNDFGQLGDGTIISKSTPVQVSALCQALSVNEIAAPLFLSVFPNPSSGDLEITIKDLGFENAELAIYDVLGEKIYSEKILNPKSLILNLAIPKGIYFLHLWVSSEGVHSDTPSGQTEQRSAVKKIIIAR